MSQITYEQPLNERIRLFLRLDFLFQQIDHTLPRDSAWDSRATLVSLLDILNIFSRSDLKTEVIMELERISAGLSRLENTPGVDHKMLTQLLDEIDRLVDLLHCSQGQIGHQLRQNEFLSGIKQRSSISGGTCDFDLPSYHYWLERPIKKRQEDLQLWISGFDDIRAAIALILKLIRDSATSTNEIAESGFFQRTLETSAPFQLIRVTIPDNITCFAEISGGKHRFTVRFMSTNLQDRPTQSSQDIGFILTTCAI